MPTMGSGDHITIKWKAIEKKLRERVTTAVNSAAESVRDAAEQAAPKRKVFKYQRRRPTRVLNAREFAAELDTRKRLGLSTTGPIRTVREGRGRRHLPSNPFLRAPGRPVRSDEPDEDPPFRTVHPVAAAMHHRDAQDRLNSRARHNLAQNVRIGGRAYVKRGDTARTKADVEYNRKKLKKTNTALFRRSSGKYEMGGRLKAEIHADLADGSGSLIQATVISPTYYARYVEFGTSRSIAQPYLRPALATERMRFRKRIAESLSGRKISGGRMV